MLISTAFSTKRFDQHRPRAADIAFQSTKDCRLWIGHFIEDNGAGRCYPSAGFKPEGITRGSAFFRCQP